jgi:stearoyl-CoA desaturase (delta-9 desaturase)
MFDFALHPDSALVDHPSRQDVFAPWQAATIVGMHILAVSGLWLVSVPAITAFVAAHLLCLGGGIALGYHRLLAHRSFRTPRWFRNVLATLGTLTFQVGPLLWVAIHRAHHKDTDQEGDAHASVRGFWWSHMGWTFYRRPNGFEYAKSRRLITELADDAYLRFLNRHMVLVNLAAAAVTALVVRRGDVVLWAFPVRIVVGWHLTWLINSYAHFAPIRGPKRADGIRNSAWLAFLAFGEGWHGNHHRYPGRANFALTSRQVDPAYVALRGLNAIRLVELKREASELVSPSSPRVL